MRFKPFLAGSLVAAVMGLSGMPVLAQDSYTSGSLHLSPQTDMTMGSYNPQNSYQDNISLRGHVTTVPKGTIIMIKMDQSLHSASSRVGDPVSATVESDVYINNEIAIPAGSVVEGSVASVNPAGHVGKAGSIEVRFHLIKSTTGLNVPLQARIVTSDNSGVLKGDSDQAQVLKTLGVAAGGTAAGTLMGTAAGGLLGSVGGGATFGLAAGGLAGLGYAIMRQGKQVVIPSGARMSIVLDQPLAAN